MDFKLPDIGEGVHEGEITKWLVKPGDAIKADQPMVEVMTDKATVEIPSPVSGTVSELVAKEGETVSVGGVMLRIDDGKGQATPKSEAKPAPQAAAKSPAKSPEREIPRPAPVKAATPQREPKEPEAHEETESDEADSFEGGEALPYGILATPATRKLARELDVDIRALKGTGSAGRVTKTDVQVAYEGQQAASQRPSHSTATGLVAAPQKAAPGKTTSLTVPKGSEQRIPLKGIRKKIAEAMAHSKHTAAHFTYVEEVDLTEIVKLRASVSEEAKKRGVKMTFLPFIIKAVIPCLQEFPFLNSSLDDDRQEIVLKGDYNIGIATDTPNGLMVPVIKNADRKNLWELASEITTLSEKCRTGKISIDELKGGTFTLTNAGSIGGVFATPVINHPEVAILGVNAIRKRPMVVNDQIVARDMMFLSISVDHRVVDGADAARFMNRLVFFLSDPLRMVFA